MKRLTCELENATSHRADTIPQMVYANIIIGFRARYHLACRTVKHSDLLAIWSKERIVLALKLYVDLPAAARCSDPNDNK